MIDSEGTFPLPFDQQLVDQEQCTPDINIITAVGQIQAHVGILFTFVCFVKYYSYPFYSLQFINFLNIKNSREHGKEKPLRLKAFSSPLFHPAGFVFAISAASLCLLARAQ